MDARQKLNFKIDSYTPETLPMARLVQYLAQLVSLYGSDDLVHFDKLIRGSAIVQVSVDAVAVPAVLHRLGNVRSTQPDPDAEKAYRAIDKLLRADNAVGSITRGKDTNILEFPGRTQPATDTITIHQPTTVDGVLIKIGGRDETIPVTLRSVEGKIINGEIRGVAQAKELSRHYMNGVLRVAGNGKWSRTGNGEWLLEALSIQSYEVIDSAPLDQVLFELRSVEQNGWGELENSIEAWKRLRGRE